MTTEAIILAGGLGTRLQSEIGQLPKSMAPVAGVPFINFLIRYLQKQGIEHFIFALGHEHEMLTRYIDETFGSIEKDYSIENQPLGTGGAARKASEYVKDKDVFIVNGDTIFNVDLAKLYTAHQQHGADSTLALKPLKDGSRYGKVAIDQQGLITAFRENQPYETGLINGGVYALNVQSFLTTDLPLSFSFERDYLQQYVGNKIFYGVSMDQYFIDIGVPGDYQKFQEHFKLIVSENNNAQQQDYPDTAMLVDIFLGLLN